MQYNFTSFLLYFQCAMTLLLSVDIYRTNSLSIKDNWFDISSNLYCIQSAAIYIKFQKMNVPPFCMHLLTMERVPPSSWQEWDIWIHFWYINVSTVNGLAWIYSGGLSSLFWNNFIFACNLFKFSRVNFLFAF